MTAPTSHSATIDDLRSDLLARLGLDDTTTPEDLAAAHESVEQFLASAPRHLGAWARRQASSADEAYALLTDPAALARTVALGGDANRRASAPGGPATPTVRQETPAAPRRPAPAPTRAKGRRADDASDVEPTDEELAELIASVTPSAHRDSVRTARARTADATAERADVDRPVSRFAFLRGRAALVAGGIALVAIVAFAGYRFGGGGLAASLPLAGPSASPAIDVAAVTGFMNKIAANPKDTESLQGLADLYYAAGDYTSAGDFLDRILAYDPTNVRALLGSGAAAFNNGDSTGAEAAWKKVVAIDAKSVEAHYDLGFLYLNLNDLASVKREWELVVQLDPGSDVAKNVQKHLDALAAQASGRPAASGAASPAAPTPSASPAQSAVPSAGPTAPAAATPAPSAAATGSARP